MSDRLHQASAEIAAPASINPDRNAEMYAAPILRIVAAPLLALLATAASAQEMADTLCPILADVAAEFGTAIPEAAQAQLVMRVAGAYDYDPDALDAVLDGADEATGAACPADRAAVIAATGKATLAEAMR